MLLVLSVKIIFLFFIRAGKMNDRLTAGVNMTKLDTRGYRHSALRFRLDIMINSH